MRKQKGRTELFLFNLVFNFPYLQHCCQMGACSRNDPELLVPPPGFKGDFAPPQLADGARQERHDQPNEADGRVVVQLKQEKGNFRAAFDSASLVRYAAS
jgi:hypothetical protein